MHNPFFLAAFCAGLCIFAAGGAEATHPAARDAPPGMSPADLFPPPPPPVPTRSSKLLATGGVSQVEGSAGTGVVPWALIGTYAAAGEIGANAFVTGIWSDDYRVRSVGAMAGFHNRLELSVAQQTFDTRDVGAALGLGEGFKIRQTIVGAKVRLFGDAILDQDSWLPQVAVGVQYKDNDRSALLSAIGARDDQGVDVYLAGSKLLLDRSVLLNGTVRLTRANQIGILGFGGEDNGYRPQLELSGAYLLARDIAVGADYRFKPDNLGIAREDDWWNVFVAWFPGKNVSVTLAYADLGNIVIRDDQRAAYISLQIGF